MLLYNQNTYGEKVKKTDEAYAFNRSTYHLDKWIYLINEPLEDVSV